MHAILWVALAGCAKDKEKSNTAAARPRRSRRWSCTCPTTPTARRSPRSSSHGHPGLQAELSRPRAARIVYTHLKFRDEGVWAATGYVEAQDEKMDCSETGTWTMEPATSQSYRDDDVEDRDDGLHRSRAGRRDSACSSRSRTTTRSTRTIAIPRDSPLRGSPGRSAREPPEPSLSPKGKPRRARDKLLLEAGWDRRSRTRRAQPVERRRDDPPA
jgi:hypothetical protein